MSCLLSNVRHPEDGLVVVKKKLLALPFVCVSVKRGPQTCVDSITDCFLQSNGTFTDYAQTKPQNIRIFISL
jgi:hypothetical protein